MIEIDVSSLKTLSSKSYEFEEELRKRLDDKLKAVAGEGAKAARNEVINSGGQGVTESQGAVIRTGHRGQQSGLRIAIAASVKVKSASAIKGGATSSLRIASSSSSLGKNFNRSDKVRFGQGKTGHYRMGKYWNRNKGWKHPVFATASRPGPMPEKWPTQVGNPGWFPRPIRQVATRMSSHVAEAVKEALHDAGLFKN